VAVGLCLWAWLGLGLGLGTPVALAQQGDEALEFLKRGEQLYSAHNHKEAMIEFENVLLIDPTNVEAQLWLVRIYADRKQPRKARELLDKVKKQAPDNVRVLELEKLLGKGPAKVTHKEGDLVMHETLTLLGKNPNLREFGLVVPDKKVRTDTATGPMLLDDEPEAKAEGPDDASLTNLDKFGAEEGPLSEVFDIWTLEGLTPALTKYFELVCKDKSLGALNDKNLLNEGLALYGPKLAANAKDEDARFFVGMVAYLNGHMDKAKETLEPLRGTDKSFQKLLAYPFSHFDILKSQEEARKREEEAARQRAEEAAREAERQKQAALAAASASAAAVSGAGGSGTADVAGAPGSPEAVDSEGYGLYKKGQLDSAIEKFQAAIKGNPNEPKFHFHLGLAMTDKGLAGSGDAFDRAIESFNKVIALSPGSKQAKDAEVMIRDIVAAKNSMR